MQYTSASFGAAITAVLPGFLAPASVAEPPRGVFPGGGVLPDRRAGPVRREALRAVRVAVGRPVRPPPPAAERPPHALSRLRVPHDARDAGLVGPEAVLPMTSLGLLAIASALVALSGLPGLLFPAGRAAGQRIATVLHVAGCAAGAGAAAWALAGGGTQTARFAWPLPGGFVTFSLDRLSAFFLVPVFVVSGLGSIYGEGYWEESRHPGERAQAAAVLRPRDGQPRARDGGRRRLGLPRRLGDRLARGLLPRHDRPGRRPRAARGMDLSRVRARGHPGPLRDVRAAPRRDRRMAPRALRGPRLVPAAAAHPRSRARRLRPQGRRDPAPRLAARTRTRRRRVTSRRSCRVSS